MGRYSRKQLRKYKKSGCIFDDKFKRLEELFRAYGFEVTNEVHLRWSSKFLFTIPMFVSESNIELIKRALKTKKGLPTLQGHFRHDTCSYENKPYVRLDYCYSSKDKYNNLKSLDKDIKFMRDLLGYKK
jgi:hypothetical protein